MSFTEPTALGRSCHWWFVWCFFCCEYVLCGTVLTSPPSLCHCFCPLPTLTGYHVPSSVVEEGARWESRHLLQEVYDNESKFYSEPRKNCTDPGKTGREAWSAKCERKEERAGLQRAFWETYKFKQPCVCLCKKGGIMNLSISNANPSVGLNKITNWLSFQSPRGCILSSLRWARLCIYNVFFGYGYMFLMAV